MSFASFPLDAILPSQAGACARAGLSTASDVLLPLDPKKVRSKDLVLDVARAIAPQSRTISELLQDESHRPCFVSSGDDEIDRLLGGGARVGAITELAGESAAGKSTMTLSFAVAAGLASHGAIVLTSERVLATSRLVELATSLRSRIPDAPPLPDILDNIHASRVADVDTLEHALAFVVPPMLQARLPTHHSPFMGEAPPPPPTARTPSRGHKPIRLLILDSLTALLRGETERTGAGLTQRSRYLCSIADRLKALAVEYELAVLVVNQVSDVFTSSSALVGSMLPGIPLVPNSASDTPPTQGETPPMLYATQARHFSGQGAGVNKEAALGVVWANAVNTRLMLARTGRRRVLEEGGSGSQGGEGKGDGGVGEEKVLIRRAYLVFSGFAAPGTCDFVIAQSGVWGLTGSYRAVDLGPAIRRRDARLRAEMGEGQGEEGHGDGEADVIEEGVELQLGEGDETPAEREDYGLEGGGDEHQQSSTDNA